MVNLLKKMVSKNCCEVNIASAKAAFYLGKLLLIVNFVINQYYILAGISTVMVVAIMIQPNVFGRIHKHALEPFNENRKIINTIAFLRTVVTIVLFFVLPMEIGVIVSLGYIALGFILLNREVYEEAQITVYVAETLRSPFILLGVIFFKIWKKDLDPITELL